MKCDEGVKKTVRVILEASREHPRTRARLREMVRVTDRMWEWHRDWSEATWDRRIREAIAALIADGVPVVSDGHGFRIAASREELEAGLQKKERMALSLLREVSQARKIPLNRLVVQLGLFEEVA